MQKLLSTILFLTYFVVSTGFTVNLHYCMDRYHSWEMGTSSGEACATCDMPTSDNAGCCRDEVKTVRLQQDLVAAKSAIVSFSTSAQVLSIVTVLAAPFHNWSQWAEPIHTGPPLPGSQETYLENCVFRL